MPDGSSPDSVSATAPAGTGNEASGCVITGGTNNETGYIVTIKDADGDTNLNGDDTLDGTVGDATGEIIAPLPLQIGNYYHVGVMNETSCKGQQAEAQSCWAYLWYLDGYYSDQENDYIDAKYAHIIPNFAAGAGVDGLGQDADKDYTFFNPITTVDKEIYHTTGPSFDDNSKIQFGFWTTVDQAPGHYYDVVKLTFAANPLTPTP
jgi:hypothetical protein